MNCIFDIDGTLVNLRSVWEKMYNKLYQQNYGFSLTDAEMQGMFGPPELECHQTILQGRGLYTSEKAQDLVEKTEQTMLDTLKSTDMYSTILPGVIGCLDNLQKQQAGLACATGNIPSIAEAILSMTGLRSYFLHVACSELTTSGRSEIVWRAYTHLQQLHKTTTPDHTVVIGDTPSDIKAAQRLGMMVVAVATGNYTKKELVAYRPDFLLSDLREWGNINFSSQ